MNCPPPRPCRPCGPGWPTNGALGISFIYAAQTWRQLAAIYGEEEARALFGLTNVLVMFGGSKDVAFNREVSDLVGTTRVARTNWNLGLAAGRSTAHGEDMAILRPEDVRQLPEKHALVIAENRKPIIAGLTRCIEGKPGKDLLEQQRAIRTNRRAAAAPRSPTGRGPWPRSPPNESSSHDPVPRLRPPAPSTHRRVSMPTSTSLASAYQNLYLAATGVDDRPRPAGQPCQPPQTMDTDELHRAEAASRTVERA